MSNSSDDELLPRAFKIDGDDESPETSGPPTTGEQYLKHVR
jgi:hypothetical protein